MLRVSAFCMPLALATTALTSPARFNLLAPFGDFALREPAEPIRPAPPAFYAATGPDPEWQIAQWNIPGGKLPPFSRSLVHNAEVLTSVAAEASVRITRTSEGEAIELAQDGRVLPCTTADGRPRESDLFFAPKDRSATGANALRAPPTPLASLRSLVLSTTVSIKYGMTVHPKGCLVNQGTVIVAIVLNNLARRPSQTLFYQLGLNQPCGPGPAQRVRLCLQGASAISWFSRHHPFGVDDRLALVDEHAIGNGERRSVTLDLLARLRELIAAGPTEMDRDPSHWTLDNLYAGQAVWGDFKLASRWEGLQITLEPNQ